MPAVYDPEELANAEASAKKPEPSGSDKYEGQVGRGYISDANQAKIAQIKPSVRGVLSFAGKNRGKLIIGGVAASLVALLIIGFFALLPFKILHIVNNLQSRFFATSENAVQKETDVLFSNYIRKYVLPGLNTCKGSTVDKGCTPRAIQGTSLVSNLYRGWSTARLENKLADKYGLEFKKAGNSYFIKTPDFTGNGIDLKDFVGSNESLDDFISKSNDGQFKRVGRAELRQAYRNALSNETRWKQAMYRFKVGGLLSRKYGLKRCIIACATRDNFADWKDNKTKVAKMILAERVLVPRSETLALVIQCVLDSGCDPSSRTEKDTDGRNQSKIQQQMQQKLNALAADNTGKYASVLAHSQGILDDGYKKYLVKQVVKSLGGDATAVASGEVADKVIPIIGWINAASSSIGTLEKAPTKIKALSYATNASAMVSLYTTYRTYADETKSGHIDLAILGSFNNSLGPSKSATTGGTASAEQSPLYQNLIDGVDTGKVSTKNYICNNGKLVPAGRLICQEEVLGGENSVLNSIKTVVQNLGPLKDLADFWNYTAGSILKKAIGVATTIADSFLRIIPGYTDLVGYISRAAAPIITAFTNYLIPSPFGDNMSGGRTFDLMAGGADVAGNDYAQNGLGGKVLTTQQASVILAEQTQQSIQEFKSKSFFARMFDTNSNYSLVTKVAMAMPDSWSSASQTIASIFSDPFGKINHAFASLFSFNQVFAATAPVADPFGVTQYGYPAGDPNLATANADPETYWEQNCSKEDGVNLDWDKGTNASWQNSATTNSDTGMPESDSTNPCLLIQAAAGSAGAIYGSSLLTQDDLSGSPTNSGGASENPGASASLQDLAKQVLADPNVSYPYDAISPNGGTKAVLQAVASGQAAPVTCQDKSTQGVTSANLNPNILKAILDMAQGAQIGVNALTDKCHTAGSNHYKGLAVDFECQGMPFDVSRNDAIAAKYGGHRNSEICSVNKHWHYDF